MSKNLVVQMLQVGEKIPQITLCDDRKKDVCLQTLCSDRFLVLFFYPKDYVPSSTKESCIFRDNYQKFQSLGAEVIGISADSVDGHRTFKENYSLPFRLLSDPDNEARTAFKVPKSFGIFPGRATFVIDRSGVVRLSYFDQFNIEKHVEESFSVIKDLCANSQKEGGSKCVNS